ncbi:MAG TPA: ABC transporter permease [Casimicrobiaceae bacterium]|nr:ABC transporter permease [Casimicrobiaceae bacterium]
MTTASGIGWYGVALAIVGGALRVSTPYLFVSLGEVLTERSGRVNLGLEGTLLMGAMSGFAVGSLSGSPWFGVLAAAATGALMGLLHAGICNLPRVNDIAVGIALFIFGIGLAFYLGKPFIAPRAAMLPALPLAAWSSEPAVRAAFEISPLLLIGIALAIVLQWAIFNTRWGLFLRMAGESADAARALGRSVNTIRTIATTIGGAFAGVGGAFLSLYYPGNWNEGLSSGQGLMAIALVIFARWSPLRCLWASLLFGGASALGPALQTVGVASGYYLYSAAPYVLTLALLIYSSSTRRTLAGAPSELSISR